MDEIDKAIAAIEAMNDKVKGSGKQGAIEPDVDESDATAEDNQIFDPDKFQVPAPHITQAYIADMLHRATLRANHSPVWSNTEQSAGLQEKARAKHEKAREQRIEMIFKVATKTIMTLGDYRLGPLLLQNLAEEFYDKRALADRFKMQYQKLFERETAAAELDMENDKKRLFEGFDRELMAIKGTPSTLDSFLRSSSWLGPINDEFTYRLAFFMQNPSAERLAYLLADTREGRSKKMSTALQQAHEAFRDRVLALNQPGSPSLPPGDMRFFLGEVKRFHALTSIFSGLEKQAAAANTPAEKMLYEILYLHPQIPGMYRQSANDQIDMLLMKIGAKQAALTDVLRTSEELSETELRKFREVAMHYRTLLMTATMKNSPQEKFDIAVGHSLTSALIKEYAFNIKKAIYSDLNVVEDILFLHEIVSILAHVAHELASVHAAEKEKLHAQIAAGIISPSEQSKRLAERYEYYKPRCDKIAATLYDPTTREVIQLFSGMNVSFSERIDFYMRASDSLSSSARDIKEKYYFLVIKKHVDKEVGFIVSGRISDVRRINIARSTLQNLKSEYKEIAAASNAIEDIQASIDQLDHHVAMNLADPVSEYVTGDTSEFVDETEGAVSRKGKSKAMRHTKTHTFSKGRANETVGERPTASSDQDRTPCEPAGVQTGASAVISTKNATDVASATELDAHLPPTPLAKSRLPANQHKAFFNEVHAHQKEFYHNPDKPMNVGSQSWATQDAARELGRLWLGEKYHKSKGSGTYVSADGLRRFRLPKEKSISSLGASAIQANFEERITSAHGQFKFNFHLNIASDTRLAVKNRINLISIQD